MESLIDKIRQKLKSPLPGEDAQFMMAPLERARTDIGNLKVGEYRNSAVMLLICRDETDDYFIPLTERFAYDGVHSGQVSLPGGKRDEADNSLTDTALRECFEEIGIEGARIAVLGELSSLFIPVSKFVVHPVVGFSVLNETELMKNPREVKSILKLYLRDLVNENIVKNGTVTAGVQNIKAPYFLVEGHKVWGATAMILSEFKTVLKTIF